MRETAIEATFKDYSTATATAVAAAKTIRLDEEDGVARESFAEYDLPPTGERDWEYGENIPVSVVKEEDMEAVMRLRG